jgi:hypothetical protein
MKFLHSKRSIFINIILFVFFISILIYAHATGITGVTLKNGNPPGCTCHNPTPSSNVVVKISGPDTVIAGQTAQYTLTLTGGPLVRGGTDIAVSLGTLAPISSDLRLDNSNGELTHSLPKSPSGGAVTFSFNYTAPQAPGAITMYANGNSVNFNGNADAGDMWNFAPNKTVTIVSITGITDANHITGFELRQNYPNPFNPSTTINYQLPMTNFVTLRVYDMLGRVVKTLVNEQESAGTHSIPFNAAGLPSGIYIYQLRAGNYVSTKKMILSK